MSIFGKNTPAVATKNGDTVVNQVDSPSLEQLEITISELIKKINLANEKNQRQIQAQKGRVKQLKAQLETLERQKSGDAAALYSREGNPAILNQIGKRMTGYLDEIAAKKLELERIELDITILERTRDEESIKALVQAYKDYEKLMFSQFISPLEELSLATKTAYFETLKQLRSKYTMMENVLIHLDSGVLGNENVPLHNWVNAIQKKPHLLITKDDQIKELTITNTYLAE